MSKRLSAEEEAELLRTFPERAPLRIREFLKRIRPLTADESVRAVARAKKIGLLS